MRSTDRAAAVAEFIARNLQELNGTPDDPHSFDGLDAFLDAQVYRLSHWKAAADEINYRRFFDINELAAVCMESPQVFAESHGLVFELLVHGDVSGLRVDHIDGLYDPAEYLRRLQRGYLVALGKDLHQRAAAARSVSTGTRGDGVTGTRGHGDAGTLVPPLGVSASPLTASQHPAPPGPPPPWSDIEPAFLPAVTEMTCTQRAALPLYVVVEKILGADEALPEDWLLAGTTGYDFLNSVAGLFVDPSSLTELSKIYGRFIDERLDFREVAQQSKRQIFRASMSSELQLLAHRLNRISQRHRRSRDFTLNTLRTALREILVCFSVYRTYIREGYVLERDRQAVCRAAAQAKRRNPATDADAFDFIRDVLLLERPPDLNEAGRRERELFVGRVQQVTSPVTAKGIEDTAFYRVFPLASLNEVGSSPLRGAVRIEDFHRHNLARQAAWPQSLIATTTHDTKRSEDARADQRAFRNPPSLAQSGESLGPFEPPASP